MKSRRTDCAVFLDRDGVLNRSIVRSGKPFPPEDLESFEILPEVLEALQRLRKAGFHLIVVTNQPDVARGTQERSMVEGMNEKLISLLPLDAVKVCYHDDSDRCDCRKPKPGMLLESASEFDLDLERSYLIGDRWKDIEAGRVAGCTTILIDRGYSEPRRSEPDRIVSDLNEAAEWILRDGEERAKPAKGSL